MTMMSGVRTYRSIWISDVHLGTRGCKADLLLDFLKNTDSQYLYLVGDMIDGWRLRRSWYWPQAHNDVVQKLLRKARKGTRVIYIPGNHDNFVRDYADFAFGEIEVHDDVIHQTADGRRFLVIHGDQFDGVVQYAKWLARLGDQAYTIALTVNGWFNGIRRLLGYEYWSLSAYLKYKVKNAVKYITSFEETMADIARRRSIDGIICGHIHHAELRHYKEIWYANDGDWVESCTALAERHDGTLEILYWTDQQEASPFDTSGTKSVEPANEGKICEYSSSPMRGLHKSTAWFVRWVR